MKKLLATFLVIGVLLFLVYQISLRKFLQTRTAQKRITEFLKDTAKTSSTHQNPTPDSIKVLVLPPYDEIANLGASPDTQGILEEILNGNGKIKVIPFPLKRLMNVNYQMVFDKKYCKPIVDRVACEVIIMNQIITKNEHEPGFWPWAYRVRIYNIKTNQQIESISGNGFFEFDELRKDMAGKIDTLVSNIHQSFASD